MACDTRGIGGLPTKPQMALIGILTMDKSPRPCSPPFRVQVRGSCTSNRSGTWTESWEPPETSNQMPLVQKCLLSFCPLVTMHIDAHRGGTHLVNHLHFSDQ